MTSECGYAGTFCITNNVLYGGGSEKVGDVTPLVSSSVFQCPHTRYCGSSLTLWSGIVITVLRKKGIWWKGKKQNEAHHHNFAQALIAQKPGGIIKEAQGRRVTSFPNSNTKCFKSPFSILPLRKKGVWVWIGGSL